MVELTKQGPPLTEEQLSEVERTLGVIFPADYRQLMLKANGGLVDPGSFDCIDGTGGSHIGWLYYVLPGDKDDILEVAKVREGRLPSGFVAIGPDAGGNEICIDCNRGAGYGSLYFWDHEMEADESQGLTPETAGNTHLIANSFTEFIKCLYERSMDHIVPTGQVTTDPEHKGRLEALMKRKGLL